MQTLIVYFCVTQVFGVEEQESVCLSRLGGTDQRERSNSQQSAAGEKRKPGRVEAEVQTEL